MEQARQGPCLELCWVVIRMSSLGYWPHTIEACTGIHQAMVHEILVRFHSTGQVIQPVGAVQTVYLVPQTGYYGYTQPAAGPPPPVTPSLATQAVHGQPTNNGNPGPYMTPVTRQPPATDQFPTTSEPPVSHRSAPAPEPVCDPQQQPPVEHTTTSRPDAAAPTVWVYRGEPGKSKAVECSTIISHYDVLYLRMHIEDHPQATLRELCDELLDRQVSVSPFELFRTLRRENVAIRKDESRSEENRVSREEFAFAVGAFQPDRLVFICQFSCNIRYGWSVLGRRRSPRTQKFTVSFALARSGVIALQVIDQPPDSRTYSSFVEYTLSWMDTSPQPKSVAVLSGRRVEDEWEMTKRVCSRGMECLLIPPKSPDYNPTKQAVSSIKLALELDQKSMSEADSKEKVETIIHHHVSSIDEQSVLEWFQECGYA